MSSNYSEESTSAKLSDTRDGYILPISEDVTADSPIRPIQRLGLLCDEGSLQVIRSGVASDRMGDRAREGDGVVGAAGRIGGRPIFCDAQDAGLAGGSLGEAHADTIVRVQRLAGQARVPVIGAIESGGVRLQEGIAALNGYARIFSESVALSGRVPQISVLTGTSAGGGSYSPALTDFVVMTNSASMFLTGPRVVREVIGEQTMACELGGPQVQARNGVCQFVAPTEVDSIFLVHELLEYLPQNAWDRLPQRTPTAPTGPQPAGILPVDPRRPCDMRDVFRGVFDGESVLEVSPRWAPNIVTALARLDGHAVGVIANQPGHLGGVIDAEASQKAARFVRVCNAFGLPLLVLVDARGFLPGTEQERAGVIRHGAKLLHAFAEATVPRLTVVLRKSYGGAYITMNSKDLGAHMYLAWADAEIGIMGPQAAVEIVHRRELAASADRDRTREQLAHAYRTNHLTAAAAARNGYVDELIAPNETRARLTWWLRALGAPSGRAWIHPQHPPVRSRTEPGNPKRNRNVVNEHARRGERMGGKAMRLGISGTYSAGKTMTAIALSHYTGIPRTRAKTMRELLPDAAPGKTLEQCTAPELLQMIVVRHAERAVHEGRLQDGFVSDGSSLQEWIYGTVRVIVGINPNDSVDLADLETVQKSDEIRYFEAVMAQLGLAFKRHVKGSFDAFVHLRNELPLVEDGHRPVNDRFRFICDQMLVETLDELEIPHQVIDGSLPQRLERIVEFIEATPIIPVAEAIDRAQRDYDGLDVRPETERAAIPAG